jgi:GNAT superfamily N-acetyltransferase
MGEPIIVRHAEPGEISVLARLWYDGWQDAHASILPAELARRRTLESFVERLMGMLDDARVAGPPGAPLGLCIIRHEELDQLYVSPAARGTGIAAAFVADAEKRLAARGVELAWLACAIGNTRAARFYEKCGWTLAGTVVNRLETVDGPYDLEVWRYEKRLRL